MKEFRFDEAKHVYTLDGKNMTGVTSILGVIAKPALIQWAANEATKYAKQEVAKAEQESAVLNLPELYAILEEARYAHRMRKESAADIGSMVHKQIERYVTAYINEKSLDIEPLENKKAQKMYLRFLDWATDNNVHFLESEQKVYSEKHWYAGTCDLVFEMDGEKWIGDIKTSKGIYGREWFAQMAGYQLAMEEMGLLKQGEIKGRKVIRIGKVGNDFETRDSFDYRTDKKIFLACVELYRGLETFNK